MNLPELKLNAFLLNLMKPYNAKPFLTGKDPNSLKDLSKDSHFFIKGKNYLEVDVNVYEFCYLARKVAYNALPTVKEFVIDVALTVEGHNDEELPEQVLGCTRVSHIPVENALTLETLIEQQQQRIRAAAAAAVGARSVSGGPLALASPAAAVLSSVARAVTD